MFEGIDKKLEKIGFVKLHGEDEESKYGAYYRRKFEEYGHCQRLDIYHKESGKHLIISYQEDVNAHGLNNAYGLTYKELKLAMKKYRQMKRKYSWK